MFPSGLISFVLFYFEEGGTTTDCFSEMYKISNTYLYSLSLAGFWYRFISTSIFTFFSNYLSVSSISISHAKYDSEIFL